MLPQISSVSMSQMISVLSASPAGGVSLKPTPSRGFATAMENSRYGSATSGPSAEARRSTVPVFTGMSARAQAASTSSIVTLPATASTSCPGL